jgi:hypothetical protein
MPAFYDDVFNDIPVGFALRSMVLLGIPRS